MPILLPGSSWTNLLLSVLHRESTVCWIPRMLRQWQACHFLWPWLVGWDQLPSISFAFPPAAVTWMTSTHQLYLLMAESPAHEPHHQYIRDKKFSVFNKIPSHVLGMPAQWVCQGFWDKSNKPAFSIWMRFLQVNRGHTQRNTVT